MQNITFKEELIRVEYVIGEDVVREIITGDIEIPEQKPDIERVLEVSASPTSVKAEIVEGGVEISGDILCDIVYVAIELPTDIPREDDNEEVLPRQSVHFAEGTLQFNNFIDIPGARPGMNVIYDVSVTRTSFRQLSPRDVEISVTIRKFVKVTEFRQMNVITNVFGLEPGQIQEELLCIEEVVGENVLHTLLEECVEIPCNKPPAERILRTSVDIFDIQTLVAVDSIIVSGTAAANVVYVGDTCAGDQPVHFVEGTFTFEKVVPLPGARPGKNVYPVVRVQRIKEKLLDPTKIELKILLEIFVRVTQPRELVVVTDIDCEQVDVRKELLRVEEVIGEKIMREALTQEVIVPPEKPSIERILEVRATVIEMNSIVEEGGVTLSGQIEVNILYVALAPSENLQQPVHFMSVLIPFENYLPIPGTRANYQAHTDVFISRVGFRLINSRTMEVEVVIDKFAKVTVFRQLNIVVDMVVISPSTVCPPSFIVYVVQPGDTLYRIARRFQTSVEELVRINDISDPDNLFVGQKICVPKCIIEPKG